MSRAEIFEKLNALFAEVLNLPEVNLQERTTADEVDGWDSLAHITLIAEIEDQFDMQFPMKSVLTMKNVGELVDIIMEAIA